MYNWFLSDPYFYTGFLLYICYDKLPFGNSHVFLFPLQ